jgi:DNA-binding transcriptional LysR family regulator
MEMHQVRYFLAVCEAGNFTRAAERCNVSQPALTMAIKKLEGELGGPLFHRERTRALPTRLGELMRPHFEQLQSEAETALRDADSYLRFKKVPLNIGVMVTVGPTRLGRLLAQFRGDNPEVEVAVREGDLEHLTGGLDSGDLDLAVLNAPGSLDKRLRADPLYSERYMVLLPPGHPLESRHEIALAELSGEAYVDRLACEMRDLVMATCAEREVELYAAYRSEREDWIQGMVMAGLGFAFMPEHSVTLGDIACRPLVEPVVERTISMVSVAGRRLAPAAAAFARAARGYRWPDQDRGGTVAAPD